MDGLTIRSDQHEERRLRWSRFIQHPLFNAWRIGGPIILSFLYLLPLFIITEQSIRIWLICTAALLVTLPRMPTLVTLEWTWRSAVDHLELIRRDEAHEAARPGATRMLEELDNRRNMQRLHLNLGLLAFASAFIAVLQEDITLGPQLLLISASITELVLSIQPYLLRNWGLIPDIRHPMLSIYKPCQHSMQLRYPLTDVIETHLDPWTRRIWGRWREGFETEFRAGRMLKTPQEGLERLLLLEHLQLRGKITEEELESKQSVFKYQLGENTDRPDIEYFLLHIYGQCSGLIQLMDRMLESLTHPLEEADASDCTVDAYVQRTVAGNAANLLVRLSNHGDEDLQVTLRATSHDAVPMTQSIRLPLKAAAVEARAYPLYDPLAKDAIDAMSTLSDDSEFLWMTLAWPAGNWKNRMITLELETDVGEQLHSSELEVPVPARKSMLWFRALTRIERLASQGGLIPL